MEGCFDYFPKLEGRMASYCPPISESGVAIETTLLVLAVSAAAAGFLSSTMGTSTPPQVAAFAYLDLTRGSIKGIKVFTTLWASVTRIILFALDGEDSFKLAEWPVYASVCVASLLGSLVGSWLRRYTNKVLFFSLFFTDDRDAHFFSVCTCCAAMRLPHSHRRSAESRADFFLWRARAGAVAVFDFLAALGHLGHAVWSAGKFRVWDPRNRLAGHTRAHHCRAVGVLLSHAIRARHCGWRPQVLCLQEWCVYFPSPSSRVRSMSLNASYRVLVLAEVCVADTSAAQWSTHELGVAPASATSPPPDKLPTIVEMAE
jgi:hypothetical protein